MKRKDEEAFIEYVLDLAAAMGLRDWSWHIDIVKPDGSRDRPDGKTWGASSECIPHQKLAVLKFSPSIRQWSPKSLKQTVVHELLHSHTAALHDQVRTDLAEVLKPQAYLLFESSFTRNVEWCVDGIATEWARTLPDMVWPKAKKRKKG